MSADHLDDDVLSDLLDGNADSRDAAHADSCAQCRARLIELTTARDAIAERVAPRDPRAVDAAIVAALVSDDRPARVSQPRRVPLWLVGAAAVVLAVGVAVPLARGLGGPRASSKTSAGTRDVAAAPAAGAGNALAQHEAQGSAAAGAPGGSFNGTVDLGSQNDSAVLARAVRASVPTVAASSAEGSSGTAQGAAASGSAPSPGAPTASAVPATPVPSPPCLAAAAANVSGTVDQLRLQATLRWHGQAAILFAFDKANDGGLVAVVLSTDGCRPLVTVTA